MKAIQEEFHTARKNKNMFKKDLYTSFSKINCKQKSEDEFNNLCFLKCKGSLKVIMCWDYNTYIWALTTQFWFYLINTYLSKSFF